MIWNYAIIIKCAVSKMRTYRFVILLLIVLDFQCHTVVTQLAPRFTIYNKTYVHYTICFFFFLVCFVNVSGPFQTIRLKTETLRFFSLLLLNINFNLRFAGSMFEFRYIEKNQISGISTEKHLKMCDLSQLFHVESLPITHSFVKNFVIKLRLKLSLISGEHELMCVCVWGKYVRNFHCECTQTDNWISVETTSFWLSAVRMLLTNHLA